MHSFTTAPQSKKTWKKEQENKIKVQTGENGSPRLAGLNKKDASIKTGKKEDNTETEWKYDI